MTNRTDPTLPETPLRAWRKTSTACSYAELARRVGCSRRTILSAAAGRPVSREHAIAIRRETGISLDRLLGDAVAAQRDPREESVRDLLRTWRKRQPDVRRRSVDL